LLLPLLLLLLLFLLLLALRVAATCNAAITAVSTPHADLIKENLIK